MMGTRRRQRKNADSMSRRCVWRVADYFVVVVLHLVALFGALSAGRAVRGIAIARIKVSSV
jgi:hypothetical protein